MNMFNISREFYHSFQCVVFWYNYISRKESTMFRQIRRIARTMNMPSNITAARRSPRKLSLIWSIFQIRRVTRTINMPSTLNCSMSFDKEKQSLIKFGASVYTASSFKHNCTRGHSTSRTSLITTSCIFIIDTIRSPKACQRFLKGRLFCILHRKPRNSISVIESGGVLS